MDLFHFCSFLIVTLIYNCIVELSIYRIPSIMTDAQYPSNVENRNRRVYVILRLRADISRDYRFSTSACILLGLPL